MFDNGAMAWSPHQGGNMVTSAYRFGSSIYFQWGDSAALNYDAWLITVETSSGQNIGRDWECQVGRDGCSRTAGYVHWDGISSGIYRITVEGCDFTGTGSHDCKEGFTYPVYVRV
jgi:hypothetical protein